MDFNSIEFRKYVQEFYSVFYEEFRQRKRLRILWECDFAEDKLEELERFFKQLSPERYNKEKETFFVKNKLPFLESIYLTYIGWKYYEDRNFWKHTAEIFCKKQNEFGEAFIETLKREGKGLKIFEIQGPYRYVRNILFHCGISKAYINMFLDRCLKVYKNLGTEITYLSNEKLADEYFSYSPEILKVFIKEGKEVSKGFIKRILESFYIYEDSAELFERNPQDLPKWIFENLKSFVKTAQMKKRRKLELVIDEDLEEAHLLESGHLIEDLSHLETGYGLDFLLFDKGKRLIRPYSKRENTLVFRELPLFVVCKTELGEDIEEYVPEEYQIQGKLGRCYRCFKVEDLLEDKIGSWFVEIRFEKDSSIISGENVPEYVTLKNYPHVPVYMGIVRMVDEDLFNKITIYDHQTNEVLDEKIEDLLPGRIYRIIALGGWGEEKKMVFGLIREHKFKPSHQALDIDGKLFEKEFLLDELEFNADLKPCEIVLRDNTGKIREIVLFDEWKKENVKIYVDNIPRYYQPARIEFTDNEGIVLDSFRIKRKGARIYPLNIPLKTLDFPVRIELVCPNFRRPIGLIINRREEFIKEKDNLWTVDLNVDAKCKIVLHPLSEVWNRPKIYEFKGKRSLKLPEDLPSPQQGSFLIKIYIGHLSYSLIRDFNHYNPKASNFFTELAACFAKPEMTGCLNKVKFKQKYVRRLLPKLSNIPYPYLMEEGWVLPLSLLLEKLKKGHTEVIRNYIKAISEREETTLQQKLKLCLLFDMWELVKDEKDIAGFETIKNILIDRGYKDVETQRYYDYRTILLFRKKLDKSPDLRTLISNLFKEHEAILNKIAANADFFVSVGETGEFREINSTINNILLSLSGLSSEVIDNAEKEFLKKLLWRLIEIDPNLLKLGIIYWRKNGTFESSKSVSGHYT